ncbi:MAG: thermonuclease family protein [Limnohabitans sp.]
MKPNPHALVSALLLASLVLPAQAFEQGWVSWVIDGDTVVLVPQGQRESVKLRIAGIDAPEACQTGGESARLALIALVQRRTVRVQTTGQDSYGRPLGRLWVDQMDVGAELVRQGQAWAYEHRTGRGPYAALQRQARSERKGLFAVQDRPRSPAVFRQFNGSCHPDVDAAAQAQLGRLPQTGQSGSR